MSAPRCVAVFDLDSTVTKKDTYVAFLLFVLRHLPLRWLRAPRLGWALLLHVAGFRDNTWLKATFLGIVAGDLPRERIALLSQKFCQQLLQNGIRPKARAALAEHRAKGHRLLLATASFDFYVTLLAKALEFDSLVCTKSLWKDEKLCGAIEGENCYGPHKAEKLAALFAPDRADWHILAYTDHHSDLPLLLWADEPYAVTPSKKLRAQAQEHGIPVLEW